MTSAQSQSNIDVRNLPDGYLVEIEQPAGVGSTEPAESEGAGSAGAEAAP